MSSRNTFKLLVCEIDWNCDLYFRLKIPGIHHSLGKFCSSSYKCSSLHIFFARSNNKFTTTFLWPIGLLISNLR